MFYIANCIGIFLLQGFRALVVKFIITYFILLCHKTVWWSIPFVVMFTTTFIHYMVVIYIYNKFAIMNLLFSYIYHCSEWHCHLTQLAQSTNVQDRAKQQMSLANMYSRGSRPARPVVACSKLHVAGWGFVYILHNHELTVNIYSHTIAHAFHHYLSSHHLSYTLLKQS